MLEELIRDTAVKQRVEEQGYRASDERLAQSIRDITAFHGAEGQFSMDLYRGQLANAGLTPAGFEALQRESLEVGDLQSGIVDSTFLTPAEFRRYIELYNQRREVAYALFDVEAFSADIAIDDAAITARYESNQAAYQTTETVDLEYFELALAADRSRQAELRSRVRQSAAAVFRDDQAVREHERLFERLVDEAARSAK